MNSGYSYRSRISRRGRRFVLVFLFELLALKHVFSFQNIARCTSTGCTHTQNAAGGKTGPLLRTVHTSRSRRKTPLLESSSRPRLDGSFFPNQARQHQGSQFGRRSAGNMGAGLSPGGKSPEMIEKQVNRCLESLREAVRVSSTTEHETSSPPTFNVLLFPTARECNSAIARFGDSGDLLRALRLFGKMRKSQAARDQLSNKVRNISLSVPAPTLVTYSTLMSRAVKLNKPRVALRIWKLKGRTIVPDLKAVNILMNCYAKLSQLDEAQKLLKDMKHGENGIPYLKPNIVTYNSLLNACQRTGNLDAAVEVKAEMDASCIRADVRTYTSLISTVARRRSQIFGQNDPSAAFSFLEEMKERGIAPNGMTYSALIDACGRCNRSDLAMQGLRTMLRQRAQHIDKYGSEANTLPNEVGAWTAAIDACGKAGRWETAISLFYKMEAFGCEPNTITCGCLTDSLLRNGRTAETLEVLRHMKTRNIAPSEVMYTSLMTRAEMLVKMENREFVRASDPMSEDEASGAKAIDVYTELMASLLDSRLLPHGGSSRDSKEADSLLLRVSLVFQGMKNAGGSPDVACYNALLRACARAMDIDRAFVVLDQIVRDDLCPNDYTWRELLRAASKMRSSDTALSVWKQGISFGGGPNFKEAQERWVPSVGSFSVLVNAFLREAESTPRPTSTKLYEQIVGFYEEVLQQESNIGLELIDSTLLQENPRAMMLILQAVVRYEQEGGDLSPKGGSSLRSIATEILNLECMKDIRSTRARWIQRDVIRRAESWLPV